MQRLRPAVLAATALLLLVAWGDDDDDTTTNAADGSETPTVEVDMVDTAFEPDTLQEDAGETVRFGFTNRGEVAHDAFIGDADAQADHEDEIREADDDEGHEGGHGDDTEDAVTVEPDRRSSSSNDR